MVYCKILNFQGSLWRVKHIKIYVLTPASCNIELLKTDVEKRKDKLRNIAKRIVKKPQAYMNMEADLRYWAKEYKTTIYELHDPKVEYPDDFEW